MLVGVMAMYEASRYKLSRLVGSKPMLDRTFGAGTGRFDYRGHSVILSGSMAVLQGNINTKKSLSEVIRLSWDNLTDVLFSILFKTWYIIPFKLPTTFTPKK